MKIVPFSGMRQEFFKKEEILSKKWKPPLPPRKCIRFQHVGSILIQYISVNFSQKRGNPLKEEDSHPCFLPPRQPIKFTDLDKSHMKRRGLLYKHFCKKIQNIPNETEEIVNFLFSHYKSMGTIHVSCHSNQSSYPTGLKNTTFVEGNVLCKYAKFQLHPPYGF